MTTTGQEQLLDSAADVLGFVRSQRRLANVAEAAVLAGAVTWAEQHPPESIHLAATWPTGGAETGLLLAGEGAPLVAEAVELKHRLPRTWARVQAHDLPAWRARRVAAATLGLTREAAEFVDAQVAPFAHKIGPAALDRLVVEAVARFMPARALEEARAAADGRHVTIHRRQVSFTGTSYLEGELDLADALDLDAALSQGAWSLKAAGCTESLDVRRSIAAGEIARRQLALDLQPDEQDEAACGTVTSSTPKQTGRQVVLHVHLSDRAITGTSAAECDGLGRIENTRQPITA
ncbi:MAG: HNH endonuclease, partial [Marmoricola sp.]